MLSDPKKDDEAVNCKACGRLTRMTGTKLCDGCWEVERHSVAAMPVLVPILERLRKLEDAVDILWDKATISAGE